jgi:hypothetical protein
MSSTELCGVESSLAAPFAKSACDGCVSWWVGTWEAYGVAEAGAVGLKVVCGAGASQGPLAAWEGRVYGLEEPLPALLTLSHCHFKPRHTDTVWMGAVATAGSRHEVAVCHGGAEAAKCIGCCGAGALDLPI